MEPIKDLKILLKSMNPAIMAGQFVFCSVSDDLIRKMKVSPLLIFREHEGITIIVEKNVADEYYLSYENVWAMITLTVHSDLNAVGFLSAITSKLAEHKISVNAVSAFYHDHIFVPSERKDECLQLLNQISEDL